VPRWARMPSALQRHWLRCGMAAATAAGQAFVQPTHDARHSPALQQQQCHTALFCTVLYCTVLHCTALYCTAPATGAALQLE
jgi:hypothetical protein